MFSSEPVNLRGCPEIRPAPPAGEGGPLQLLFPPREPVLYSREGGSRRRFTLGLPGPTHTQCASTAAPAHFMSRLLTRFPRRDRVSLGGLAARPGPAALPSGPRAAGRVLGGCSRRCRAHAQSPRVLLTVTRNKAHEVTVG